jgi:DNA-binding response OmpR family regulator
MPDDVQVVLADDDPNILTALGFIFEEEGIRYVSAVDGTEALGKIRRYRPPVAVLDVMFPGPTGYEICQEIRRDSELRETHVILLSALGQEHEVAEGFRSGADAYFTKPFSIVDLLDHLEGVLGKGDS